MQFITGNNLHQTFFNTFEEQVSIDNAERFIDAFIDKHDSVKMGFTKSILKSEGRHFFTCSCKKNCFVPRTEAGANEPLPF